MCIDKYLKSKVVRDLVNFYIQSLKYFLSTLCRLIFNIKLELKAN